MSSRLPREPQSSQLAIENLPHHLIRPHGRTKACPLQLKAMKDFYGGRIVTTSECRKMLLQFGATHFYPNACDLK